MGFKKSNVTKRKTEVMRTCKHCGKEKPVEEFEPLTSLSGQFYELPSDCCKRCWAEYKELEKQHREELAKKWMEDAASERARGLR